MAALAEGRRLRAETRATSAARQAEAAMDAARHTTDPLEHERLEARGATLHKAEAWHRRAAAIHEEHRRYFEP